MVSESLQFELLQELYRLWAKCPDSVASLCVQDVLGVSLDPKIVVAAKAHHGLGPETDGQACRRARYMTENVLMQHVAQFGVNGRDHSTLTGLVAAVVADDTGVPQARVASWVRESLEELKQHQADLTYIRQRAARAQSLWIAHGAE